MDPDDKKEAREDDKDKNKSKKGIINPQLHFLHTRRVQDTAVGWDSWGLI